MVTVKLGLEYRKLKQVMILDRRVFKPCEIKQIDRGFVRRKTYLVHFDGQRWDVLEIARNGIRRYIFQ